MVKRSADATDGKPRQKKFNYEEMKRAATDPDAVVRKKVFIEYFERFEEFPSYLFDNESHIDPLLRETVDDIQRDPETPRLMREGVEALLRRLPS